MVSDVYFPRVNGVSTAIQTYRQQLPAQGVGSVLLAPRYGKTDPEDDVERLRRLALHPERQLERFDPGLEGRIEPRLRQMIAVHLADQVELSPLQLRAAGGVL